MTAFQNCHNFASFFIYLYIYFLPAAIGTFIGTKEDIRNAGNMASPVCGWKMASLHYEQRGQEYLNKPNRTEY